MNIIDLAFKHKIEIEFAGDEYGGEYLLAMNYLTTTQSDCTETTTKLTLRQWDIDELYSGARNLVRLLERHASRGYP